MKILFTGFEPFGGDTVNPSWKAVSRLLDEIGGAKIAKLLLPVSYARVRALLEEAIEREAPDAVVCVGQAGGRAKLTPEKVAINLKDAAIPDGDGALCRDEAIDSEGETAYFSTLPLRRIVRAMEEAGAPAAISYSTGTYVCNSTMYQLMAMIAGKRILGGFIHIPFLCEQTANRPAGTPSLPLCVLIDGLRAAAEAIALEIRERQSAS